MNIHRCAYTRYITFLVLFFSPFVIFAQDFTIQDHTTTACILYDKNGPALDSISAHLLQQDIQRVTGTLPALYTDPSRAHGNVIVIGNSSSALVRGMLPTQSALTASLTGKWECYGLNVVNNPAGSIKKALIIAGSDTRGTAYGVFSISEKIGVSPWYWWADVPTTPKRILSITVSSQVSATPSVKYRGIFLNDEDWGLQPWAAKTFEPETGDIGPKTYSKIFELLLRLKANLIWPAMHPSTKAFYSYPGNAKVAADYAIIVGSSHAEPMLRNNVGEWTKEMGAFNYITNKDKVYTYWEQRVKESAVNNAMYTIGMRGVHDSGMEGVKGPAEAVPLLHKIFADQRGMLSKYLGKSITAIPQVFTAYKEVLDIYDQGLQLPDDVTLVWPDDNYGYISRLNNEQEKHRPGGSGIYYHASYWGRPHDYLWLSSTHPELIREEMMKAYETGSTRLWILNVGDIKPLEYNIQLFMDMAYSAAGFKEGGAARKHLEKWAGNTFGKVYGSQIASILWEYDDLAFERRPEFMGWSQTEPTTKTARTAYNHFFYGDEAQRRIDRYDALETKVTALRKLMPVSHADAFYELVYYPVKGASLMNKKFLFADKSMLYAKQNRLSAADYAIASKKAYDEIVSETDWFNNRLVNGKWKNMMSMAPRGLPVYSDPALTVPAIDGSDGWSVAPEGFSSTEAYAASGNAMQKSLPVFYKMTKNRAFIDLFLSDTRTVTWRAEKFPWITLSLDHGILTPQPGKNQVRIWVDIDWKKAPATNASGMISFTGEGKLYNILVKTVATSRQERAGGLVRPLSGVENNGYVSIAADHPSKQTGWHNTLLTGNRAALMALPFTPATAIPSDFKRQPSVEYNFLTFTDASPIVNIYTLPTHPLNAASGMRYGVSIDDGPVQIVDFKTVGRSEEWKQNVLRNMAIKQVKAPLLTKGEHTLKIYMIDPGVVLRHIVIDLGGMQPAYGLIPPTAAVN